MAQQGPPPGRPHDYPSLDELSPEDDRGPQEHGAQHRGRGERPLRSRRAERPERPAWDYADPFAPDADANLPSWAPPSEFPPDRPPALPRRPGRNRPEDDDRRDDGRGFRRLGHRRPDGYDSDHRLSEHSRADYDQSGYSRLGSGTASPGRRQAGTGPELAEPGYQRPERATSHRRPSYDEQSQHGAAGQGYAEQGYAGQGYADQGYAEQGYAERPSGGHHRPDAERPSGSHHRPDAAAASQQPATGWRDTDPKDTGEFEQAAPGYGLPGYAQQGDGPAPGGFARDRPRHGRPVSDAGDGAYHDASASGSRYTIPGSRAGSPDADARVASADAGPEAAETGSGAGTGGRPTGLPGRLSLPRRARGRAAAARLRKSRRKVYRWSGVGIALCVVVALVVVIMHHSPKPLPYVTTLLAGEFKSVPGACNSVSAGVLNQYLPEPGRTMADQLSGSTQSECSFTVDRKPVFLELNVTAEAFQPFAPATAAGSKPGSATANAADNLAEVQQGLAHPSKTAPQSPARILPLDNAGQQAFVAVASEDVTGINSEIVTVVIRDRNVLITVSETGQESGHGFGPVSVGALEAGAQAAARDVLAKAKTQPTA